MTRSVLSELAKDLQNHPRKFFLVTEDAELLADELQAMSRTLHRPDVRAEGTTVFGIPLEVID